MFGPLFSISSSAKVELTHQDLQEIINHKHIQKINIDFKKLIKLIHSDANKDLLT